MENASDLSLIAKIENVQEWIRSWKKKTEGCLKFWGLFHKDKRQWGREEKNTIIVDQSLVVD